MKHFARIRSFLPIIIPLLISACQGVIGQASFQPAGTPLVITIDTQGKIEFSVETNVKYPTPLGTFSVGLVVDPAKYFQVENTLTVRVNDEDHIYDLHGQDFQIDFAPGYYEKVAFEKSKENILLVLRSTKIELKAPRQIAPPDGSVFDHYPRTTVLQWSKIPGASSYVIEIDCYHCCEVDQWCTDIGQEWKITSDITSESFSTEFVGAQPGRWRVWAVDSNGVESPKSPWWVFRYTQ